MSLKKLCFSELRLPARWIEKGIRPDETVQRGGLKIPDLSAESTDFVASGWLEVYLSRSRADTLNHASSGDSVVDVFLNVHSTPARHITPTTAIMIPVAPPSSVALLRRFAVILSELDR